MSYQIIKLDKSLPKFRKKNKCPMRPYAAIVNCSGLPGMSKTARTLRILQMIVNYAKLWTFQNKKEEIIH